MVRCFLKPSGVRSIVHEGLGAESLLVRGVGVPGCRGDGLGFALEGLGVYIVAVIVAIGLCSDLVVVGLIISTRLPRLRCCSALQNEV